MSYKIQISTSPLFSTIYDSATVSVAGYRNSNKQFAAGTTYFWRVKGANIGGDGPFSNIWSFKAGSTNRIPVPSYSLKDIDYGRVRVGKDSVKIVSITNWGNDTLKITGITPSASALSVDQNNISIPPGASKNIVIRFTPIVGGAFAGSVTVNSNAATSPEVIVVIGYGLKYSLQTSATSIDLGKIKLDQAKDTTFYILNTGNDTLLITEMSIMGSGYSLGPIITKILPGLFASYTIRYNTVTAGQSNGLIVIKSNASTSPDTVKVIGYAATYGLKISVTHLDMGLVLVGKYKDTTFTITNTGNDTLRITNISTTAQGITSRVNVLSVLPNGSAVDTIRFSPTAVGLVSGTMILISNAPTSPDTIRVSASGVTATTGIAGSEQIPSVFMLTQNYPNPFNPSTVIRYAIPKESKVVIQVYNSLGEIVANVVDEIKQPGYYSIQWRPELPSGIYFYRIQAGNFVDTKKLLLIR
ncbi:MAG: choice-of-anchor D domain-containing protein [bacterium]